MRSSLRLKDLPTLYHDLEGSDLKIVLDLLSAGERHNEDGTIVYEARVEDIAQRTNLSTATVYKRLRVMNKRGQVATAREWGRGRGGGPRRYMVLV